MIGAILNGEGEILLFRHTYRGNKYPWGLPSGWLKPREDPAEAIVREIREETGLEVCVTRPLLSENARVVRRIDLVFLCEIVSGAFRPSTEVVEMRYFKPGALPPMMETQYDMIAKILETQKT